MKIMLIIMMAKVVMIIAAVMMKVIITTRTRIMMPCAGLSEECETVLRSHERCLCGVS